MGTPPRRNGCSAPGRSLPCPRDNQGKFISSEIFYTYCPHLVKLKKNPIIYPMWYFYIPVIHCLAYTICVYCAKKGHALLIQISEKKLKKKHTYP